MEGGGEGVDSVIQELRDLHDAALAVTVLNRRLLQNRSTRLRPKPSIHLTITAETNTDSPRCANNGPPYVPKFHIGTPVSDGHYISTYRMAHCCASPTSSRQFSTEYPQQTGRPSRQRGNFKLYGHDDHVFYSSPCDSLSWCDRESSYSQEPQQVMESFIRSLRKYPMSPEQESSDIIHKLLNHTQNKHLNKNSKVKHRDHSPPESPNPETSLKNTNKAETKPSRDFGSNTSRDLRVKVRHMRGRSFNAYYNKSIKGLKEQISDTYDYLLSPCPSKRTCPSGILRPCPSKRTCPSGGSGSCPSKRTCPSGGSGSCPSKRRHTNMSHEPCTENQSGYFNEIKKYIREVIKQMYEEKPAVVCPRIRSRYSHHIRKHHPEMKIDVSGPSSASREPLISSKSSRCFPAPYCPPPPPVIPVYKPCACSSSLISALRKIDAGVNLTCPYCFEPTPCSCKKFLENMESQADVKDVVLKWLKELPIPADDTRSNKAQREELIHKLAEEIKIVEDDPDFENKTRVAVKKCLQYLPIWYPSNPNDQDVFKNQIIDDLFDRIRNYLYINRIKDIIKRKLSSLQYIHDIDIEEAADNFTTHLIPWLDHPDQLKGKLIELILELPIANKNEALSSIIDGFVSELTKIPGITKPEEIKDISDAEIENIVSNWLESSPEFISEVEPKDMENIVQKIHNTQNKHLSEQAERDQMNRDVVTWIDSFLKSKNEILDTNTKQNLANKLVDQIKVAKSADQLNVDKTDQSREKESMKMVTPRKRWIEGEIMQSIPNEIHDLVKDIPALNTKEKVDTVTNKIANVISKRSNELSTNPSSVVKEIADILTTYTANTSATDTENLASAIVSRVKGMTPFKKRTSFQSKKAFATKDLEKQVTEKVEKVFYEFHITPNESVENVVVDSLIDEIVRGHKDHTRENIKSALHQSQVPDSLADSIADTLLDISKNLEVMSPSMSSRVVELDFGSATPQQNMSDFKDRNPALSSTRNDDHVPFGLHSADDAIRHRENEKQYAKNVKGKIRDWIDELPISSTEKSYIRPTISDLTNNITERQKYLQINHDVSTSPQEELDNLKYLVFRWVNKIPEMEGKIPAVVDQTGGLMDELLEISVPQLAPENTGTSIGSDENRFLQSASPSVSNSPQIQSPSQSSTTKVPSAVKSRKLILKHKAEDAVERFAKTLPLQKGAEKIPQPNLDNLAIKITDILLENNVVNDNNKDKIKNELKKFLEQAPVNSNVVNVKDVTEDFIDVIRQISKTQDELFTENKTSPRASKESALSTYTTGTNTPSKIPRLKTTADKLFQFIDEWSKNLPLKGDTPEEKEKINKIKKKIANRLTQKVGELNMNPENFKDDFMFEELFEDEIEDLISEIPELKRDLPQLKKNLMGKVKEARRRSHEEMAGKEYKQQLRDALSKTIPPESLNKEEEALFDVLKDDVVDGFLSLHYADETPGAATEHRKKLRAEIDKFSQNYLNNHPNAQIDSQTLNKHLYEALRSIPPPKEGTKGIRSEIELIRNKETCDDWAKKNNLLKDKTPAEKLYKNKALAVLATKIKEIEKTKEQSPDCDYDDILKNEIDKWLTNTAKADRDDIGKITDELISQLKKTERTRHVDSSAGHAIAPEYDLSSPDPTKEMRLKAQTAGRLPSTFGIPPTTLSPEEQMYMEKIRQRKQAGYPGFDDTGQISGASTNQAPYPSVDNVGYDTSRNQAGYPGVDSVGSGTPRYQAGYSGFGTVGSGTPRNQAGYPDVDGVGSSTPKNQATYPGFDGVGSGTPRNQVGFSGFGRVGSGTPRNQAGYPDVDGVGSSTPRNQATYPGFDAVGSVTSRNQANYPGVDDVGSGTPRNQVGFSGFGGVGSGTPRNQAEYPGIDGVGSGTPRNQATYPGVDAVGSVTPRNQAGFPGFRGVGSGTPRNQAEYSSVDGVGSSTPRNQAGYSGFDGVGSGTPRNLAGYPGFDAEGFGTPRKQPGYPGINGVGFGTSRNQATYPGFDAVGSSTPRNQTNYPDFNVIGSGTSKHQADYPGFDGIDSTTPRNQAGYPGFDAVGSGTPRKQPGYANVDDIGSGTSRNQATYPDFDDIGSSTPRKQAGYPGFEGVSSGTPRNQDGYPDFVAVGSGTPRKQPGYPGITGVGSGTPRYQAGYPSFEGVDFNAPENQAYYPGIDGAGVYSGATRNQAGHPGFGGISSGSSRNQASFPGFDGISSGSPRNKAGHSGVDGGVGSGTSRDQAGYPGFDTVGAGTARSQAGYPGVDGISSGSPRNQAGYTGVDGGVGSGTPRDQASYPGFNAVGYGTPRNQAGYPGVDGVGFDTPRKQATYPGFDAVGSSIPRSQAGYPAVDGVGFDTPRNQAGYPGFDAVGSGTPRKQPGYLGIDTVGSGSLKKQSGYPGIDTVGSGARRNQTGYPGFDAVGSKTTRNQAGYPPTLNKPLMCPQRPLYAQQRPPCLQSSATQQDVPCPRSTYQDIVPCPKNSAGQQTVPCPQTSSFESSHSYPRSTFNQQIGPYRQMSPNQQTVPYPRISPPCVCPKTSTRHSNPQYRSYPDRTFRRPVIPSKCPSKIYSQRAPFFKRCYSPKTSPCTAKHPQALPKAMASWKQHSSNVPSKRFFFQDVQKRSEEDEDVADEENDVDEEEIPDSKQEYCKCEVIRSSREGNQGRTKDILKKCSRCCGIKCPYPSYCYFNP